MESRTGGKARLASSRACTGAVFAFDPTFVVLQRASPVRPAPPRFARLPALSCLLLGCLASVRADPRVAVVTNAREEYSERRLARGPEHLETYVFMAGHFFGGATVDRSLERMPFRRIAEYLAPELAKQRYVPTTQLRDAELLLVVHWGATIPYTGTQEMMARESAVTDTSTSWDKFNQTITADIANPDPTGYSQGAPTVRSLGVDGAEAFGVTNTLNMSNVDDRFLAMDRLAQLTDHIAKDTSRGDNVSLLGYADTMRRMSKQLWTDEAERVLRYDLDSERYFIIVQAYELKDHSGGSKRPVWTMHLNISSPGNNFSTALNRMSLVAGNYAGSSTGTVISIRPTTRNGKVTLAPMVILGEVMPKTK